MNTYNTKLQTNNTNLSDILDKVNTLPDAESGSGTVETCTVTFTPGIEFTDIAYYNGENLITEFDNELYYGSSITVAKNSFVCFSNNTPIILMTDNTAALVTNISDSGLIHIVFIYSDCTIDYQGYVG